VPHSDALRVARPPPDSYDPRTMATSSLRAPILGVLALALVALLGLAWRILDSGASMPVIPEPIAAQPTPSRSVELVAAVNEPEHERVVEELGPATPQVAARAPDLEIRGRIVSADGGGIADVEVSLPYVNSLAADGGQKSVGSPKKPFAKTNSGTEGSFHFALHSPPVGPIARFQLAARSAGWSANERWIDVPEGARTVDVGEFVLTRSCTLRGIVRDVDGALVEGASVRARVATANSGWNSRGESTKSAVDGSFLLQNAPSGELELVANEDVRGTSKPLSLTLEPGEDRAGLELVLPVKDDSAAISGIVLDSDGTPLPKAHLDASYSIPTGGGGGTGGRQTDAAGRFRIRGLGGALFDVTARHPRGEAGSVTIESVPAGTHDLVLRLTPIALATLRVTSTDGAPVTRFAFRVRVLLGQMRTIPTTSKIADRPNGECALPLPDTEFTVEIDAPGFASTEIGGFHPTPNPGVLEARLEPLPALRGFVVRGNEPVVGARVRAQQALGSGEQWQRDGFRLDARPCDACPVTKTSADGSFALEIGQPGFWRVRAESASDVSALCEPVEVSLRRAHGEVRIDLALRGSIRGHVRSANGSPLARRRIGLSAGDGDPRSTMSDAGGAYEFEGVAPGGYQVRLLADDDGIGTGGTSSSSGEREVPPIEWDCHVADGRTTTHDIVVPDPVRLEVRIVADAPLDGTADWEVTATPDDSLPNLTAVRSKPVRDRFVLELPSAGSWWIHARLNGAEATLFLGRKTVVSPGGAALDLEIAKGSIRGRLRAGTPGGATVSLTGSYDAPDQLSATTTAGADGSFEFPFAMEGTVHLEPNGESVRRRSVQVTRGIVNDVGEL